MKKNNYENPKVVFTIGHSTRSLDEFINILRGHSVTMVVDVRSIPRSRHNPQFNNETLPDSLRIAGIGYLHMSGLGGLRHTRKDSPNTGWHNLSFRGFADYMLTEEFQKNLDELIHLAESKQIALMCAEAVPWHCHRSLIADALWVRGIRVAHIISISRHSSHSLTAFAEVNGIDITYPLYPEKRKDSFIGIDGSDPFTSDFPGNSKNS